MSPSTTTSDRPPARVATTGRPHAIASSVEVPSPSVTELITNRSKLLCKESASGRKPVRTTCFSRCRRLICRRWRVPSSSPSPTIKKARVRDALQHEGHRVDEVALPLVWDERCHIAHDRCLVRKPELLRARSAAAQH